MIQLRLDTAALAALFPEGSDARVELQKAVIAEFLRKNLSANVSEEVKNMIGVARKSAVDDVMRELGMSGTFFTADSLSVQFKTRLRDQVHAVIQNQITEMIAMEVAKARQDLIGQLPQYVSKKLEEITNESIAIRVKERMQLVMKSL